MHLESLIELFRSKASEANRDGCGCREAAWAYNYAADLLSLSPESAAKKIGEALKELADEETA